MTINRSIADLLRSHATIETTAHTAVPGPSPIINGSMDVWQRGTAATGFGGYAGMPDRFTTTAGMTGSGAATVERSTDVPADEGFTYSAKIICTGINSNTSTARVSFEQKIETQNCQELIDQISKSGGDSLTLSFWMKFEENSSPITFPATFSCNLRDGNYGRAYCKEFTIAADATREKITLTYPAAAQTWTTGGANGAGITVQVALAVGSGKTLAVDSWVAFANYAGGSTKNVYAFDTVGIDIFITGLRLERGTTANDFQFDEFYGTTLQKCQRYYTHMGVGASGGAASTSQATLGMTFPATMRAAPTASLTDDSIYVTDGIGGFVSASSAIDWSHISTTGFFGRFTGYSGGNALTAFRGMVAYNYNVDFIAFSAEL